MGIILVIISSILFGVVPSVQNIALSNGVSPQQMLLYCNFTGMVFSLISCKIRKVSIKVSREELRMLALVGVLGLALTDFCLNTAYSYIPVGFATMIHYSYPTLICIFNTVFFKEKFGWKKLLAIILSVSGLLLLTGSDIQGDIKGVFVALLSACAYSFTCISIDKSIISKTDSSKRSIYYGLFSSFIAFALIKLNGQSVIVETSVIPYCILSGLMLVIGTILFSTGINSLGSSSAALLCTLEPVTSLVVSSLIQHYDLSKQSIIGCILIVLSLIPNALESKD